MSPLWVYPTWQSGFSPMGAPRYEILKKRTRPAGTMRGLSLHPEAPVEVFGAIDESEHESVTKVAEEAAQEILDGLSKEDASEQRESPQEEAKTEGLPRLKPAKSPHRSQL